MRASRAIGARQSKTQVCRTPESGEGERNGMEADTSIQNRTRDESGRRNACFQQAEQAMRFGSITHCAASGSTGWSMAIFARVWLKWLARRIAHIHLLRLPFALLSLDLIWLRVEPTPRPCNGDADPSRHRRRVSRLAIRGSRFTYPVTDRVCTSWSCPCIDVRTCRTFVLSGSHPRTFAPWTFDLRGATDTPSDAASVPASTRHSQQERNLKTLFASFL